MTNLGDFEVLLYHT